MRCIMYNIEQIVELFLFFQLICQIDKSIAKCYSVDDKSQGCVPV